MTLPVGVDHSAIRSLSLASRHSTLTPEQEAKFEELSDVDLWKAVNNLKMSNNLLQLENQLIEECLKRNDPITIVGIQQLIEQATINSLAHSRLQAVATSVLQPSGSSVGSRRGTDDALTSPRGSTNRSGSIYRISSILDHMPRLSISQKMGMVLREIEDTRTALEQYRRRNANSMAVLRAQIESHREGLEEVHDTEGHFEASVVKTHHSKDKITAEKFIKFMDDWLKAANSAMEKLRLRTSSLRQQYQNIRQRMAYRSEMGESLTLIDIEQIEIANNECVTKLSQKNNQLLQLRGIAGQCNIKVNSQKKALQHQLESLEVLGRQLKSKEVQRDGLAQDKINVQQELLQAQRSVDNHETPSSDLSGIRVQMCHGSLELRRLLPNILDYVKKKAEIEELEKMIKIWSRHNVVQQGMLSTDDRAMKRMIRQDNITREDMFQQSGYTVTTPDNEFFTELNTDNKTPTQKPRVIIQDTVSTMKS
uniref:Cilia- and flagella-associated protein 263 n=1 Tax=Timema cristinae TaxID=61476 RepID=A0A7R9CZM1_TIMCR|nr:unnamed protein product [Timema cristinae]